jgi:poly(rC)-binding protein 2/3/4
MEDNTLQDKNEEDNTEQAKSVVEEKTTERPHEAHDGEKMTEDTTNGADQDYETSREAKQQAPPVDVRLLLSVSEAEQIDPKMLETLEKTAQVHHASLGPYTRGAVERVMHLRGQPTSISAACILLAQKFRQSEDDNLVIRAIVPECAVLTGDFMKLSKNQADVKIHVSFSPLPMTLERSVAVIGESPEKLELGINLISLTLLACQPIVKALPEVNYTPRSIAGVYGHPDTFRRQALNDALAAQNSYITGQVPGPNSERHGVDVEPALDKEEGLPNIATESGLARAKQMVMKMTPGQHSSLQVYVPTEVVGAIIGKGGSKITEIRMTSGAMVRVNETQSAQDTQTERLLMLTGAPENIKVALVMVAQKIETERHFQSNRK